MKQFLKNFFDIKFWKFILIGILNTLVGAALTFGFFNFTPLGYWMSSALSYALSSIMSFILNRKFTFKNDGPIFQTAIRFAANIAVCYIFAYSIAKPLVYLILSNTALAQKWIDNLALLCGMVLFTAFNYIGQRYFAFKERSQMSLKPLSATDVLKKVFFVAMTFAACWFIFGSFCGVIAAICFVAIICICYKIDIPKFEIAVFALAFIVRLIIVLIITPPIVSDFELLYDASQQFRNGDYSFQNLGYFQTWAGQTGQVIFQGLLLKIWNSVFFLKLVNCFAAAGIHVLIYLTARNFFSEKSSRAVAVLYCFAIFPATMTTVLTNQHVAAFLTYLAMYLIISKKASSVKCWIKYPIAALLLAVSNMIRPDALVILVAVIVYCIFGILKKLSLKNLKHYAARLALFMGTYMIVGSLLSGAVAWSGVNANGLSTDNQGMLIKFVFGLNQEKKGGYNENALNAAKEYLDQGMTLEEARIEVIKDELDVEMTDLIHLFDDKIQTLWNGYAPYWAIDHLKTEHKTLHTIAVKYDKFCARSVFIVAFIGFIYSYFKNKNDLKSLIMPFIVFATFFVYLFIEVQPRYIYTTQIALYILAAGGIDALCILFKKFSAYKKRTMTVSDNL